MSKAITRWRSTAVSKLARFGENTWWAKHEKDARAYMKTPRLGGPCLYSGTFAIGRALDLTGPDGGTKQLGRTLSSLMPGFNLDQFIKNNQTTRINHVVGESLSGPQREVLKEHYDWIVVIDSFPAQAEVWHRLSPLRDEERESIQLVESAVPRYVNACGWKWEGPRNRRL